MSPRFIDMTRERRRTPSHALAAAVGFASLGVSGGALAQASKQEYPMPRPPREDLTAIERITEDAGVDDRSFLPMRNGKWKFPPLDDR